MIFTHSDSTELSIGKDGFDWEWMCCTGWNNVIISYVHILPIVITLTSDIGQGGYRSVPGVHRHLLFIQNNILV